MKPIYITIAIVCTSILTGIPTASLAQDAEPAAQVCFTLERTGVCGMAGTGTTITCPDGSSGPSFVRVAPTTYKCVPAPEGSGGKTKCDNTGTQVEERLITYSCAGGSYAQSSNLVLQRCHSAELGGVACEGSANQRAMDELLSILDTFE